MTEIAITEYDIMQGLHRILEALRIEYTERPTRDSKRGILVVEERHRALVLLALDHLRRE